MHGYSAMAAASLVNFCLPDPLTPTSIALPNENYIFKAIPMDDLLVDVISLIFLERGELRRQKIRDPFLFLKRYDYIVQGNCSEPNGTHLGRLFLHTL